MSYEAMRRRLGVKPLKNLSGTFSTDLLSWKDESGQRHCGAFVNQDTSTLFQLLEAEKIRIRYNPKNPDRYYHRGHFAHFAGVMLKGVLGLAIFLGLYGWQIWTIIAHHGR